ncbi:MAG: sensor histidine kinase, partial [Gemmatimonadales bacterium]
LPPGSKWVGCRVWRDGPWVVAPVRNRPPAPPPDGRERRSRERLTLELAGLALGLGDRRETVDPSSMRGPQPDPRADLQSLPAMIVHEASNPLAGARAGLQLAMETIARAADLPTERRSELLEELGLVIHDIDRAVEILRAVQDRARGAFARYERFDAVRVVRSCLALESLLLRDRGLALRFDTPMDSVYLRGDPNELFDLLVNLIRNAADASAGRPGPVEVRFDLEGDRLRLVVRDYGMGIAPEHLGRIFEPGFTTKEFGKGTGMGLARVKEVAQHKFGGDVTVESAVGEGTTFLVRLPIPPQRSSQPSMLRPVLLES